MQGSVASAPVSNLSDHRVLADNLGDSLKDLTVSVVTRCEPAPINVRAGPGTRHSGLPQVWSRSLQAELAARGRNPCAHDDGGCEALCLWDGRAARCACPHGALAPNGKNCTREFDVYTVFISLNLFIIIRKIINAYLCSVHVVFDVRPRVHDRHDPPRRW